jgi:hypothetical protein
VAKVRYRAPAGIDAGDVRVFFRMFNVAATGLEFNGTIYPRQGDGANAAPLLGLAGGEIVSIPFFAEAREADMRNQVDVTNRRTIMGAGAPEATAYFGCWIDFNQTTPRFPLNPTHNGSGGPFGGTLLSVQQLVRNTHACVVAEIHYPLDPIPNGATPGSHDNLSQRNLVVVESDNPGTAATHTVQSTFEIKPSAIPIAVPQAFGHLLQAHGIAAVAELRAARPRLEADELMIRWNDLPRDSRVTLYMPDVDAREVVAAAASRNGPHILSAHDEDTIICRVGDVGYVPVPGPRALNIPGLISVELPPTVTKGQVFTVTIHQVSGLPRKIIGSFQITIPVRTAAEILPRETRKLSVLRYIGQSIPADNRWYEIWQRLLDQIGDRVGGLGGDPDKVHPSPTGEGRPGHEVPPEPGEDKLDAVTGKISHILYDCFGQFEGFVLETCDGEHTFRIRQRGIEKVVLKACRDHLQVTVWFQESKVKRIAINCC